MKKISFIFFFTLGLISCAGIDSFRQPGQKQAWKEMTPEQKRAYKVEKYSLNAIATKAEMDEYLSISPNDTGERQEFLEKFWTNKDPNPITPVNERREEFNQRIEYVLTNFKIPGLERPWDDRGEVYLKLGPPDTRSLTLYEWYDWKKEKEKIKRKIPEQERSGKGVFSEDRDTDFRKFNGEIWSYSNLGQQELTFQFQENFPGAPYENVPYTDEFGHTRTEALTQTVWVQKVEQQLWYYSYDYPLGKLEAVFGVVPFIDRETNDKYIIHSVLSSPLKKLLVSTQEGQQVGYVWKLLIQDEEDKTIVRDSVIIKKELKETIEKGVILDEMVHTLSPGFYYVTSELIDAKGERGSLLTKKLILVPYVEPKEGVEISKAVLATEVRPATENDQKFVWDGKLVVKPWLAHIFFTSQPLYVYFRVYNLRLKEEKSLAAIEYYLLDFDAQPVKEQLVTIDTMVSSQRDIIIGKQFTSETFQNAGCKIQTGRDYAIKIVVKDLYRKKEKVTLAGAFKFEKD